MSIGNRQGKNAVNQFRQYIITCFAENSVEKQVCLWYHTNVINWNFTSSQPAVE